MSFQLHPQEKAPRSPIQRLSKDCWAYYDSPYYGWVTCRHDGTTELLRPKNTKRKLGYQFNHTWYNKPDIKYTNEQVCENIARFFWYVEGRMGWWDRTRVHPTEYPNVVQVYFSGGWLQNHTAAWLGTLILRLGGHCSEGCSLEWVLHQHKYGRETIPAVYRFLQGYQHYTGTKVGWRIVFNNRTWDKVCSMLIHTDVVREQAYLLAEADQFRQEPEVYWIKACQHFALRKDPASATPTVYARHVREQFPQAA